LAHIASLQNVEFNKKLSYRVETARRAISLEILSNDAQMYKKFHLKRLAV